MVFLGKEEKGDIFLGKQRRSSCSGHAELRIQPGNCGRCLEPEIHQLGSGDIAYHSETEHPENEGGICDLELCHMHPPR